MAGAPSASGGRKGGLQEVAASLMRISRGVASWRRRAGAQVHDEEAARGTADGSGGTQPNMFRNFLRSAANRDGSLGKKVNSYFHSESKMSRSGTWQGQGSGIGETSAERQRLQLFVRYKDRLRLNKLLRVTVFPMTLSYHDVEGEHVPALEESFYTKVLARQSMPMFLLITKLNLVYTTVMAVRDFWRGRVTVEAGPLQNPWVLGLVLGVRFLLVILNFMLYRTLRASGKDFKDGRLIVIAMATVQVWFTFHAFMTDDGDPCTQIFTLVVLFHAAPINAFHSSLMAAAQIAVMLLGIPLYRFFGGIPAPALEPASGVPCSLRIMPHPSLLATTGGMVEDEVLEDTMVQMLVMLVLYSMEGAYSMYKRQELMMRSHLSMEIFETQSRLLGKQKEVNSLILSSIWPKEIIQELKLTGDALTNRAYMDVTVLFCIIHDFDELIEALRADQVVELLNIVYIKFDDLTEMNDMYKVESVGEVYMASAGCPTVRRNHAAEAANLGLDMCAAIPGIREQLMSKFGEKDVLKAFDIRVGLATGPVVAGVISTASPRFKLIGDTVNTASRMQKHGAPGRVNVSTKVHQKLAKYNGLTFEKQPLTAVKGKGMMQMYLLGRDGRADVGSHEPFREALGRQLSSLQEIGTDGKRSTLLELSKRYNIQIETIFEEAITESEVTKRMRSFRAIRAIDRSVVERERLRIMRARAAASPFLLDDKDTEMDKAVQVMTGVSQRQGAQDDATEVGRRDYHMYAIKNGLRAAQVSFGVLCIVMVVIGVSAMVGSWREDVLLTYLILGTGISIVSTGTFLLVTSLRVHETFSGWLDGLTLLQTAVVAYCFMSIVFCYRNIFGFFGLVGLMITSLFTFTHVVMTWRCFLAAVILSLFIIIQANTAINYDIPDISWQTFCQPDAPVWGTPLCERLAATNETAVAACAQSCIDTSSWFLREYADESVRSIGHNETWFGNLPAFAADGACERTDEHYDVVRAYPHDPALLSPDSYGFRLCSGWLYILNWGYSADYQHPTSDDDYRNLSSMRAVYYASLLLLVTVVMGATSFVSDWWTYRLFIQIARIRENERKIEAETAKYDNWMRRLLPASVLRELTKSPSLIVHAYPSATIIFADIVGFTKFSASVPTPSLVAFLDKLYDIFERVVRVNHIYRVEIIGDALFAVAGAPREYSDDDHAVRALCCGFGILKEVDKLVHSGRKFQLRVGVHTGHCLGAVVGKTDPRYHVFGPSVHRAEQMEQTSVAGRVHCSERTRMHVETMSRHPVKRYLHFEERKRAAGQEPSYFVELRTDRVPRFAKPAVAASPKRKRQMDTEAVTFTQAQKPFGAGRQFKSLQNLAQFAAEHSEGKEFLGDAGADGRPRA